MIYVSSGDVSVYESQVLELLKYFILHKKLNVMLMQGYSSKDEKMKLERKISNTETSPEDT